MILYYQLYLLFLDLILQRWQVLAYQLHDI